MDAVETAIAAYIEAQGAWLETSLAATLEPLSVPGLIAINYAAQVLNPSPREFQFQSEFLVFGPTEAPVVAESVRRYLSDRDGEHVLNLFAANPDAAAMSYAPLGYQHAWTNILIGCDLRQTPESGFCSEAGLGVRPMRSADDLESADMLEALSPTPRRFLDDARFHGYVVELGDTVVAKGWLITTSHNIGYISQMYTEPASRRLGCGYLLMDAFHRQARASGCTHCVGMPSKMLRTIGLAEKFLYTELTPIAVMILRDPPERSTA